MAVLVTTLLLNLNIPLKITVLSINIIKSSVLLIAIHLCLEYILLNRATVYNSPIAVNRLVMVVD